MKWSRYAAILFDLDGVITPTAEVHMRAWSETFNSFLTGRPGQPPYTDDDYFAHVDGKPRFDGVRDFLASRGIRLPEGTHDDPPEQDTVGGLGNRKNEMFNRIITRDGIAAYPGSVRLLRRLAEDGMKFAIVSSSRNAKAVLHAAGLEDWFPVVVDGALAAREHIAGKPAPDTFQHAAALLGEPDARCVVVEDAISGVQAGAAGGFGLVIGVDRGAGGAELRAAGADIVVKDLAELVDA